MADATATGEIVVDENIAADESAYAPGATNVSNAIATLNDPTRGYYSTITATTFAEKLALAKAINDSQPLDEVLGESIALAHFIVQAVDITDSNSGEQIVAPRVTLIAGDGKAYHGTSKGLLTAVRNLTATVGDPSTWEGNFINVKVVEEGVKPRKYMTIKFL